MKTFLALSVFLMCSSLWAQKMPQVPGAPTQVAPPPQAVQPAPPSPAPMPPQGPPPTAGVPQAPGIPPASGFPTDPTLGPEVQRPSDLLAGIIEDYNYEGADRRDPFLPFETARGAGDMAGPMFPLQKFDLDQLKLVGIIWSVKKPKALILDPSGKSYSVYLNDRLGRNNGYVAKIREGEVVVVESFSDSEGRVSYQTKLLRLNIEE